MNFADVFLCAHDAGGAEIIAAWAQARPAHAWHGCAQGPAAPIFARQLNGFVNVPFAQLELEWSVRRPHLVLTGTSWASNLEMRVRNLARQHRIRSASYLEHWINYRERFGFPAPWIENLPEEVWCPDNESIRLCTALGFPAAALTLAGNPYLDRLTRELLNADVKEVEGSWLYVCEPIGAHALLTTGNAQSQGYDEFDALRYFLAASQPMRTPETRVVIRPHPSEPENKYNAFAAAHQRDAHIVVSRNSLLRDDVAHATHVVGCESMAMVVALRAGKSVFTSIPPNAPPCRLPFPGIQRFASIS